jgi:hypothetical protein
MSKLGSALHLEYAIECYQIKFSNGSYNYATTNSSTSGSCSNPLTIDITQNASSSTGYVATISLCIWGEFGETQTFTFDPTTCTISELNDTAVSGLLPFLLPEIPPAGENYPISSCPNDTLSGTPQTTWADLQYGLSTALGIYNAFKVMKGPSKNYLFDASYEVSSQILLSYSSGSPDLDFPFFYFFFGQNITGFLGDILIIGTNYSFPPFINTLLFIIIAAIVGGVVAIFVVERYWKKRKARRKYYSGGQGENLDANHDSNQISRSIRKRLIKEKVTNGGNKLSGRTRRKFKQKDSLPMSVHKISKKKAFLRSLSPLAKRFQIQ